MKNSTVYILLSNLWLIGTWFVEGAFAKLSFLILAMLWLVGYIFNSYAEMKMRELDFLSNKLKRNTEEIRHLEILEAISGKKKQKKK